MTVSNEADAHRSAEPYGGPAPSELPRWARAAMIALGIPNVIAGAWGILTPQGWFDRFPGWDPRLVAAEPPFNRHLATDAGAGLFASGLILILAAWFADRRSARLASVGFAAFAVPHAAYHALNPAPGLSNGWNAANVAILVVNVIIAIGLVVVARPDQMPEVNAKH